MDVKKTVICISEYMDVKKTVICISKYMDVKIYKLCFKIYGRKIDVMIRRRKNNVIMFLKNFVFIFRVY